MNAGLSNSQPTNQPPLAFERSTASLHCVPACHSVPSRLGSFARAMPATREKDEAKERAFLPLVSIMTNNMASTSADGAAGSDKPQKPQLDEEVSMSDRTRPSCSAG